MKIKKNYILAGVALALLLVVIWLFNPLMSALRPVFFGMLFSYILTPSVSLLEKRGIKSGFAITIVLGFFALILFCLLWFLVPALANNIEDFVNLVSDWTVKLHEGKDGINIYLDRFSPEVKNMILINLSSVTDMLSSAFGNLAGTLLSLFDIVVDIGFGMVLCIYFIRDRANIIRNLKFFIPEKYREPTVELIGEIDKVVKNFIKGQCAVALILGGLMTVGFYIVGLPYAPLFGLIAGFLDLIPFVGAFLGAVPAVIAAAFIGPWKVAGVIVAALIAQQIEENLVAPRIMSGKMGIHPIVSFIAILILGKFFGIIGIILALPICGVIKVLYNRFLET